MRQLLCLFRLVSDSFYTMFMISFMEFKAECSLTGESEDCKPVLLFINGSLPWTELSYEPMFVQVMDQP